MSLSPPQEQVLALISAGSFITAAAQTAGIHRNTIYNWIRTDPAFRLVLADAREAKALYWRDQAEQHASLAVHTIRAIMADPFAPASARLKAAQTILNLVTAPVHKVPNSAQPEVAQAPQPAVPALEPARERSEIVHCVPNSAQSGAGILTAEIMHNSAQPHHAKPGRNQPSPATAARSSSVDPPAPPAGREAA